LSAARGVRVKKIAPLTSHPMLHTMPGAEAAAVLFAWALAMVLAVGGRHAFYRALREVPRSTWTVLAFLTALALVVRLGAPDVYSLMERDHLGMLQGRTVLLRHTNAYCDYDKSGQEIFAQFLPSSSVDCPTLRTDGRTAGYPSTLALVFALTGTSVTTARAVSLIASLLTVPGAFVLTFLILGNQGAALLASASLVLMPLHVAVATAAADPSLSLFLQVLTLVSLSASLRTSSRMLAGLSVASLALAANLTSENLLLIVPVIALIASKEEKSRSITPISLAAFLLALTLPLLVHIAIDSTREGPQSSGDLQMRTDELARLMGSSEDRWASEDRYLLRNIHAPMTAVTALVGLAVIGWHALAPVLLWWAPLAAYSVYSLYSPETFLGMYAPLVPVSGVGLASICSMLFPEYFGSEGGGDGL